MFCGEECRLLAPHSASHAPKQSSYKYEIDFKYNISVSMSTQCNEVLVSVEMSGWKTSLFVPQLWCEQCEPGPWSPGLVRRGPEPRGGR